VVATVRILITNGHRAGLDPRSADPSGHRFGHRRHHHPLIADNRPSRGHGHKPVSLAVLAGGAGWLFFSLVDDAGFWLVKEDFGMTVGQTIKTWSLMETMLPVSGPGVVLLRDLVI
jgi:hypothetical protein